MAATLNAQVRAERGKNAMRRLRREGYVPAVLYGHGDTNQALVVRAQELDKLIASVAVENTIIDLKIDGGAPTTILVREMQEHPTKPHILHIDFFQIHAGEKIELDIPIRLHGTPIGVRESGGVLQEVLRELRVECLPRDIPEAVDIEIGELGIGDVIHVRDVTLPDVVILNDEDLVIATVAAPSVADLPEDEEAAEEGEPTVIGQEEVDEEE